MHRIVLALAIAASLAWVGWLTLTPTGNPGSWFRTLAAGALLTAHAVVGLGLVVSRRQIERGVERTGLPTWILAEAERNARRIQPLSGASTVLLGLWTVWMVAGGGASPGEERTVGSLVLGVNVGAVVAGGLSLRSQSRLEQDIEQRRPRAVVREQTSGNREDH